MIKSSNLEKSFSFAFGDSTASIMAGIIKGQMNIPGIPQAINLFGSVKEHILCKKVVQESEKAKFIT